MDLKPFFPQSVAEYLASPDTDFDIRPDTDIKKSKSQILLKVNFHQCASFIEKPSTIEIILIYPVKYRVYSAAVKVPLFSFCFIYSAYIICINYIYNYITIYNYI